MTMLTGQEKLPISRAPRTARRRAEKPSYQLIERRNRRRDRGPIREDDVYHGKSNARRGHSCGSVRRAEIEVFALSCARSVRLSSLLEIWPSGSFVDDEAPYRGGVT